MPTLAVGMLETRESYDMPTASVGMAPGGVHLFFSPFGSNFSAAELMQ